MSLSQNVGNWNSAQDPVGSLRCSSKPKSAESSGEKGLGRLAIVVIGDSRLICPFKNNFLFSGSATEVVINALWLTYIVTQCLGVRHRLQSFQWPTLIWLEARKCWQRTTETAAIKAQTPLTSICHGLVAEHAVQQIHDKSKEWSWRKNM